MARLTLTGNHCVAHAVKLARVKVVSAYPITPQTTIVEKISELVDSGSTNMKIIRVESEHSALAAVYGAATAGLRAFTATSSHGLLYMHEMVWWVAQARIPAVMAIVTRTIGPPWNIWTDHHDVMGQRDIGWIITMAESNQEVLDETIKLFKITEDPEVFLPGIIGLDAFILSHTVEPVEVPDQEIVDSFLPERRQPYVIKSGEALVMGNVPSDLLVNFRMREGVHRGLRNAEKVIERVDLEWGKLTGRHYGGLVECYRCEDADYLFAGAGAWVGDMRIAVDKLRDIGLRFGVLKIRYIRPFPYSRVFEAVRGRKGVLVFDRSISAGSAGPIFLDLTTHLYSSGLRIPVKNVVTGLAGFDIGYEDFVKIGKSFVNEVSESGWITSFLDFYP
ncbi:MAG: pyruvate ferredoxin oxidoreductase [Sulfolobales archaeon]|nr:pyruvate ferredoxin oxidoreductase [Sulfolobales archaeon]MDW8083535.1 pyruvate ferredoxin oxidoreductase [Sulfolobales archaeon]